MLTPASSAANPPTQHGATPHATPRTQTTHTINAPLNTQNPNTHTQTHTYSTPPLHNALGRVPRLDALDPEHARRGAADESALGLGGHGRELAAVALDARRASAPGRGVLGVHDGGDVVAAAPPGLVACGFVSGLVLGVGWSGGDFAYRRCCRLLACTFCWLGFVFSLGWIVLEEVALRAEDRRWRLYLCTTVRWWGSGVRRLSR